MHLKADRNGNIYQASRDHADGSGVESFPERSTRFGESYLENPYAKTELKALNEARLLKVYDEKEKAFEHARKKKSEAHKRLHAAQAAKLHTIESQHNLLEKAIHQSLSGADFDQYEVRDAEYAGRQLAMLQGLGKKPELVLPKYVKGATGIAQADEVEVQAKKLHAEAIRSAANYQAKMGSIEENTVYLDENAGEYLNDEEHKILTGETRSFSENEHLIGEGVVQKTALSSQNGESACKPCNNKKYLTGAAVIVALIALLG